MPTITIRETYDLSTKQGKMTLIGVHTPTKNIIERLYPGFCEQYKFCKILHQNVRVASQARLPLDPAGVGVTSEGQVSPEDVFNPILYKAVSNQSLSNLEYRIRGLTGVSAFGESVKASNQNVTEFADEFNVYYSLLANTRGWKVAHPMAGLSMRRLHPLVYEKWYNEGVNRQVSNSLGDGGLDYDNSFKADHIPVDASNRDANVIGTKVVQSMRGRPHRMPAFNTKYLTGVHTAQKDPAGVQVANGMSTGIPANAQAEMPDLAEIYTQLLVIPPSRTTTLYYRMVVETVVSFFGIQSQDEIVVDQYLGDRTAFPVYWNDYRQSKDKLMTVEENTVSASEGSTINKIMES